MFTLKPLKEIYQELAHFQFFRDGKLYYKTDSGFMFSVPIEDAGTGTFLAVDKASYFLRWMRGAHAEAMAEASKMQGDGYRGSYA